MSAKSDTPRRQTITGTVVKVSSLNTIRVATKITRVHPIYRKRYSLLRHYLAHDPKGTCKVGELVTIVTCRPISKLKHWTVLEK